MEYDGKVLWNLGANVCKIWSKVFLFLALRRPKGGPRWSVQGCNLKNHGMSANYIIYYT